MPGVTICLWAQQWHGYYETVFSGGFKALSTQEVYAWYCKSCQGPVFGELAFPRGEPITTTLLSGHGLYCSLNSHLYLYRYKVQPSGPREASLQWMWLTQKLRTSQNAGRRTQPQMEYLCFPPPARLREHQRKMIRARGQGGPEQNILSRHGRTSVLRHLQQLWLLV